VCFDRRSYARHIAGENGGGAFLVVTYAFA